MLVAPPAKSSSGKKAQGASLTYPQLRNHADLVAPWDLEAVIDAAETPLDVMLEAKAKDLAVLHLRSSILGVRPDIAAIEQRGAGRTDSERPPG